MVQEDVLSVQLIPTTQHQVAYVCLVPPPLPQMVI